jgi:hypothetical protein
LRRPYSWSICFSFSSPTVGLIEPTPRTFAQCNRGRDALLNHSALKLREFKQHLKQRFACWGRVSIACRQGNKIEAALCRS